METAQYAADAMASRTPAHALGRPLTQPRQAISDTRDPSLDQDNACSANPRIPNPSFAFPASPSSKGPPILRPRRRPMSMADIQSRPLSTYSTADLGNTSRPAALPQFSFNPGASILSDPAYTAALSSPITPNSAKPIPSPSRPAGYGHRRGGSEFVGGSIREGNSIAVMSTSPTTLSENGSDSSGLQSPPPRRGHRRCVSGAISINDLPLPHPQPEFLSYKGNSAPNSPTAFSLREGTVLPLDDHPCPLPLTLANNAPIQALNNAEENTIINHSIADRNPPPDDEPNPRQFKPGRGRVGFSDTLEFIPRPLSLVSSDTSSTVTARPGHTVSGSISSIVSAASPADRDSPAPLTRSPTRDMVESRPSTAGAILERTATNFKSVTVVSTSSRRRNSTPTMLDNFTLDSTNSSNPSPTKMPKRWSFFGLDPFLGSTLASKQRPHSSSSSETVNKSATGGSSSDYGNDSNDEEENEEENAVYDFNDARKERKKVSGKRRVKGWAGAILPLRSNKKGSKMLAVRPPTPPASVDFPDDEEDENGSNVNQAAHDAEMPSITPSVLVKEESHPVEDASSPKWRPDEDGACPMIDLDAALGPFNTPLPYNAEWDAAQQAAGNTGKRRLYSDQGMKGFSGPGMHYHRRAESAPDLPPFDAGRAGIHRFGSSSAMADVFEEDEEDEGEGQSEQSDLESNGLDGEETSGSGGEATPPLVIKSKPDTEPVDELVVSDMMAKEADSLRHSSGATSSENASAMHAVHTECSKTSLRQEAVVEEAPPIILRSTSVFGGLALDQTDSASSSPKLPPNHRDASGVDAEQSMSLNNAMMVPLSPYSTSNQSSHTSPRSPMSIDAQRMSTGPSSVTDENSFHSLLMGGEPGPELRISMDYDIRSLTSSTSTTTRESAFIPTARLSQPSLGQRRPVSVSSAAFGHRRSSLVSLSRLISSSHGERSKLSMEVTLDNEREARRMRSKDSKTKRLSRVMQFWKPNKDTNVK